MKQTLLFLSCSTALLLSGCASHQHEDPIATQLQVREIQTREFDTHDMKLVMKSMMNVLQDEGFIIKNAVVEMGLLAAEKNVDVEDKTQAALLSFCAALNGSSRAHWDKHQILEASANISEYGEMTRVRINFQTKTFDNYGCQIDVKTVKDPNYYNAFFEKVSKSIFIQKQDI